MFSHKLDYSYFSYFTLTVNNCQEAEYFDNKLKGDGSLPCRTSMSLVESQAGLLDTILAK